MAPSCDVTRSVPRSTTVYSSNSGACPGSTQPGGLCMRATETAAVSLFTRPMYSSIRFGLFPAASMTFGELMCVGMRRSLLLGRRVCSGSRFELLRRHDIPRFAMWESALAKSAQGCRGCAALSAHVARDVATVDHHT